jgi:hypothetical protein
MVAAVAVGFRSNSDKVPILLTPDESLLPRAAVEKYRGKLITMNMVAGVSVLDNRLGPVMLG